eukprot:scaffold653_cov379-Prasinococcus_capsulatus_cf.AAC.11
MYSKVLLALTVSYGSTVNALGGHGTPICLYTDCGSPYITPGLCYCDASCTMTLSACRFTTTVVRVRRELSLGPSVEITQRCAYPRKCRQEAAVESVALHPEAAGVTRSALSTMPE